MKNRLDLNFQLESAADRTFYVQNYLQKINFTPNNDELETISNYILWGKNSKGLNSQQEGIVELKKWASTPVESLDGLIETPGFQETSIKTLKEPQIRTPRVVFNRTKVLNSAPDYLKKIYEDLFREIDTIELTLNYYELFCGKRKLPPREKLLERFSEKEQIELNQKAIQMTQFKYLKLKRLLVELRSEQYSYYDTHSEKVMSHGTNLAQEEMNIRIGEDIEVRPLGLRDDTKLAQKLFGELVPSNFSEQDLKEISNFLWREKKEPYIDFANPTHLLAIYKQRAELMDEQEIDPAHLYSAADPIVKTLIYYEEHANLTPLQKDILEFKLNKRSNIVIAEEINKKYNKSYNDNYISTIFHQKVIPQIANAAKEHLEIVENLFYPENFKRCRDCGRVLLLTADNFMHQKKSSDGFSPRCKACEKIKRSKYK